MSSFSPDIVINVRDRLSPLLQLLGWLERAGLGRNVFLLDNASTWPPLVAFLDDCHYRVLRLPYNMGSRAIWMAQAMTADWYVYTDPDVVPIDECPHDVLDHLHELAERYPRFPKVGLGLYLDDLPADFDGEILDWERKLVSDSDVAYELEPGVFASKLDTTFALYRPETARPLWPYSYEGIRCAFPYQARHLSWYDDATSEEEDRYYLEHAISGPMGSSWKQRREIQSKLNALWSKIR